MGYGVDIAAWLGELGLDRYEAGFRANGVEPEILAKLSAEDLLAIGLTSIGHQRRLLEAIAELAAKPAASYSSIAGDEVIDRRWSAAGVCLDQETQIVVCVRERRRE